MSKINQEDAKNRLIKFQKIAEKIKKNYREQLLNKKVNVLFENKMKNQNRYFGRDEHFNSVIVENEEDLTGKVKNVKILKGNQSTLYGEVIRDISHTNYAA